VRTPDELDELFRSTGLRVTAPRRRIFEVLYDHRDHPTAEAVYARVHTDMPTVSLKTVYQALHTLAELGEVGVLDVGTGATRFDTNTGEHHHLVCSSCGTVWDLSPGVMGAPVTREEVPGFTIDRAEVVYRGRCEQCRLDRGPETTKPSRQQEDRRV
jgi:Fe2+ or Zn2+ uptake regulation protein